MRKLRVPRLLQSTIEVWVPDLRCVCTFLEELSRRGLDSLVVYCVPFVLLTFVCKSSSCQSLRYILHGGGVIWNCLFTI